MHSEQASTQTASSSNRVASVAALVCATWFVLTGWLWPFYICLVISYPVALLGLLLRRAAMRRDPTSRLNRITLLLLQAGLAVSVVVFFTLFVRR